MNHRQLIEGGDVAAVALTERLVAVLRDRAPRFILDLGEREVDAALLRLLVSTDRVARARGGRMVLCTGVSARRTLRATGLDLHLTLAESVADARALVEAMG